MTEGVGANARAECKRNQRRAVLELSGQESVEYMEQVSAEVESRLREMLG